MKSDFFSGRRTVRRDFWDFHFQKYVGFCTRRVVFSIWQFYKSDYIKIFAIGEWILKDSGISRWKYGQFGIFCLVRVNILLLFLRFLPQYIISPFNVLTNLPGHCIFLEVVMSEKQCVHAVQQNVSFIIETAQRFFCGLWGKYNMFFTV